MRRVKRFTKFIKDITATEYISDSDDENETRSFDSRQRVGHHIQNGYSANTLVNRNTHQSATNRPSFTARSYVSDFGLAHNYNNSQTLNRHHLAEILPTPTANHQTNLSHRLPELPETLNQSTRECILCIEQRPSTDFSERFSAYCNHRHRQICTGCVRQHAHILISDLSNTHVRCPEENCNAQFEFDVIQYLLVSYNPRETQYKQAVNRYENQLSEICIEMLPEFIWCAHGCGGGSQIIDGDILMCDNCGEMTCIHHKTRWHTGMTCAQYDRFLATNTNNTATSKWLRTKTKACPQCSARIEKDGGCDHMTCRNCRHEFCWICMADYKRIVQNGNNQHTRDCTHYR